MNENEQILDGLIKILECVEKGNSDMLTYPILKGKLYKEDIKVTMDFLENLKSNIGNRKNGKRETAAVKREASVTTVDLQPVIAQLETLDEHIASLQKYLEQDLSEVITKAVQEAVQQASAAILQEVTPEVKQQEKMCAKENEATFIPNDESLNEDDDGETTIESKLSRHMEEVVAQYNQDGKKFIKADKIGLIKTEEEQYAQQSKPFTTLADSQALTLEKKQGNVPFFSVLDEENIYFMLPKKKLLHSASEIKKSAIEKFFRINSPDDLQGEYNQVTLRKPAVIERNAEGKYHLQELGLIEVK